MKFKDTNFDIVEFFSQRSKVLVPFCALFLTIPSLVFATDILNPQVSVMINGETVGIVEQQNDFDEQIYKIEKEASEILQKPYTLDIQKEYILTLNSSKTALTEEETAKILSSHISEISSMAVVRVDDKIIGSSQTVKEANLVLDKVLLESVGADQVDLASFVQEVTVTQELASIATLKTQEELQTLLTSTEKGEAVHTVEKNETLSEIANSYGMNTNEIVTLNPDIEPERMQIGQNLVIEKAKPAISVEMTKEVTYTQEIAFETEKISDDSMTTTQKKTVTAGVVGEKEFVAKVTYIDGQEVSRQIVSEEVVKEPSNEVVKVGTKKAVSTGAFSMPVNGTLTSKYGYRSRGFHTGIDIATSYGKTISASDGGTVTFAGWNGGYGYCVIISHGNGLETLYAHASDLNVSVGQKVSKGDKIAEVGSTGNSTGNHLHFEIRVNGRHQNPYNYL